jgi:hypothetical protein
MVIHRGASDVEGLVPLAVVATAGGAAALVARTPTPVRGVALAVALGALLIAPATWAAETLGHATASTFPAGGPADQGGFGGGPGGRGRGGFGAGPGGGWGGPPPMGQGGASGGGTSSNGQISPPSGFSLRGGNTANNGGGAGGGMFGGDADLAEALAYAEAHGGGTIGVSSQQGAAAAIIASDADVAGLGGFSGRESEVSAQWLAQAVADGRIRYVLTGGGGMGNDGRVGSSALEAVVRKVGAQTSVSGLYDLQGKAAAIAAAAATS